MGYSYSFSLATVAPLTPEQLARVKQAYAKVKNRDWFPKFGETEISNSDGYSTGPTAVDGVNSSEAKRWKEEVNPIYELLLFTSQVPDVTFMVIYTFWDETNIRIYKIKDTTVLSVWQKSTEEDAYNLDGFKIGFAMTDISSDNNLDQYLE